MLSSDSNQMSPFTEFDPGWYANAAALELLSVNATRTSTESEPPLSLSQKNL